MLRLLAISCFFFCFTALKSQDLIEVQGLVCTSDSAVFTGEKLVYFHNGNLAARYQFENGLLNEQVVFYFEGGGIRETGHYLNNEKHGVWTSYNQKGEVAAMGEFSEGEKDGLQMDDDHALACDIWFWPICLFNAL